MYYLVLHTALLVFAFFLIGCVAGTILHRIVGPSLRQSLGGGVRLLPAPPAMLPAPDHEKHDAQSPAAVDTPEPVGVGDAKQDPAGDDTMHDADPIDGSDGLNGGKQSDVTPDQVAADVALGGDDALASGDDALASEDDRTAEQEPKNEPAPLTDDPQEEKANAAGTRPPTRAEPSPGGGDDLKRIKGIGKQNETRLHALGIYHFDQIAAWSPAEIAWVGTYLSFAGRIEREDWVGQATELAAQRSAAD